MAYTPDYIDSTTELIRQKAGILKALIGQELSSSFLVWDTEENEWFWDGPVILIFGNTQLELCCNKLEEISITSNTVNIHEKPHIDWDPDGNYKWRENSLEEINSVLGNKLENIYVVEFEFTTHPVGEKPNSSNATSNWILNGLDFYFKEGFFSFFNALDENGITNKETRDVKIRQFNLNGEMI